MIAQLRALGYRAVDFGPMVRLSLTLDEAERVAVLLAAHAENERWRVAGAEARARNPNLGKRVR